MTALLINQLPAGTVEMLRADMRATIEVLTTPTYTREQRIARDELVVRLRQLDWHLTDALKQEPRP